jgi:predicted transglutaminase-like cysteine proteinase
MWFNKTIFIFYFILFYFLRYFMITKNFFLVGVIALLTACGGNTHYYAQKVSEIQPQMAFISEKEPTLPPYGYVQFCNDYPQECPEQFNQSNNNSTNMLIQQTTASTNNTIQSLNHFNLSHNLHRLLDDNSINKQEFSSVIELLESVNKKVNNSILQVSDIDGFGVVENWRIPSMDGFVSDIGDCEDFVLAKRKILIREYGFTPNTLPIAVLRRPQGDVHAVLMVRTSYGDYILDNLEDEVLSWHKTGYYWMKKQSFENPSKWVSL